MIAPDRIKLTPFGFVATFVPDKQGSIGLLDSPYIPDKVLDRWLDHPHLWGTNWDELVIVPPKGGLPMMHGR